MTSENDRLNLSFKRYDRGFDTCNPSLLFFFISYSLSYQQDSLVATKGLFPLTNPPIIPFKNARFKRSFRLVVFMAGRNVSDFISD